MKWAYNLSISPFQSDKWLDNRLQRKSSTSCLSHPSIRKTTLRLHLRHYWHTRSFHVFPEIPQAARCIDKRWQLRRHHIDRLSIFGQHLVTDSLRRSPQAVCDDQHDAKWGESDWTGKDGGRRSPEGNRRRCGGFRRCFTGRSWILTYSKARTLIIRKRHMTVC